MHSDVGVAADLTDGPRRGRVYSVSHSDISDPPGLRLRTSEDGAKWTQPTALPIVHDGPIPHVAVAVSANGVLGVAWVQAEAASERADEAKVSEHGVPRSPKIPGSCTSPRRPTEASRSQRQSRCSKNHTGQMRRSRRDGPTALTTSRWPRRPDSSFHLLWIDSRDGKGVIQTAKIEVGAEA